MVDGTPVLDIKPYIPQYDYPGITQLDIRNNCDINSQILCDIDENDFEGNIEGNNLDNMNERVMDGEENGHITNMMTPESSRYSLH